MKSHDWIISVLADIEAYAVENRLSKTCEATPFLWLVVEQRYTRSNRHLAKLNT